jgi:hypothetical protein
MEAQASTRLKEVVEKKLWKPENCDVFLGDKHGDSI